MKKFKVIFIVIAVLEMTILLFLALSYFRASDEIISIDYHDLIGTTVPDDREGWYMDESFPCTEDGLFDYTEDYSFDPGVYRIMVNYETDCDSSYSTVMADTASPLALRADKVPFTSRLNYISYDVYLLQSTDNFHVCNYYGKEGYLIIKDITIVKTKLLPRIRFFSALFIFLLVDAVLFLALKRKSFKMPIFILLGALVATIPLLDKGILFLMDCGFHLTRIEGLATELKAGQFPVRLQTIWIDGYGYAPSLYYGELFLGIASILRIIGYSLEFSYKVLLFVINLATMGVMYWSCFKLSNNRKIAYVCALFYTLAPYRLFDMYSRCALGETIALTFYPLIIYGFVAIYSRDVPDKEFRKLWVPLVLGITGLLQSHTLSCIMFAEIIVVLCLIQFKRTFQKKRFIVLLKIVIYSILINAWFIFPFITSMDHLDITQPYRQAIRIQQLGNDFSSLILSSQQGIGLASLAAIGVFIYLMSCVENKKSKEMVIGKHLFLLTMITLWMSMIIFPWNYLSDHLGKASMLISNIQFATRYTGLTIAFLSFVLCFSLVVLKKYFDENKKDLVMAAVLILCLISCFDFYHSLGGERKTVYTLTSTGSTYWNIGEYIYYERTNETAQEFINNKINEDTLIPNKINTSENVSFSDYQKKDTKATVYCNNNNDEDGYIELPLLYYKQYQAKDFEGNRLQVSPGYSSMVKVSLPANYQGIITIDFVPPIFWRICEIISLISMIAIVIIPRLEKMNRDVDSKLPHDKVIM